MSTIATSLYRSIMKGTVLFGGTQMVSIVANVLRGKMVAVLLCTAGLGVSSLYMSSLMPLQQFFAMGMPIAVVSAIAATAADDEKGRTDISRQIAAFRRCLLVLALVGALFLLAIAPLMSRLTFDDAHHSTGYMLLAIALFLFIMESGETAVLQARRQMKQVAMRNVVSALAGLCVGVPFYWTMGVEGIVPAIIATAFVVWTYSRLQTHRLVKEDEAPRLSWRDTWNLGRGIIALGFFMMLAGLLGNLTNYAINASIRHLGSESDVGLYSAATSITSQYVGLVFSAMATDYYPRLSALTGNLREVKRLIHQQTELVLLIVTPLVAALIVTAPLLIRILLTEEFLPLTNVVRLTGLAIICKAACFPLDYVSMAYGNKRYFFWMEGVWCNTKTFATIVTFYYLWGIEGIGYGMLTSGLIDVVVTTVMTHWAFGINAWRLQLRLFLPLMAGGALCATLSFSDNPWIGWCGMLLSAATLVVVCLWLLARRINIKDWMAQRKSGRENK